MKAGVAEGRGPRPEPEAPKNSYDYDFLVAAAFRAAALRALGPLLRAALRACRESDLREAVRRGARFSAPRTARDRRADFRRPLEPRRRSWLALRRLAREPPGGNFTPERRAFDRPMATACLVDFAPCLPRRM